MKGGGIDALYDILMLHAILSVCDQIRDIDIACGQLLGSRQHALKGKVRCYATDICMCHVYNPPFMWFGYILLDFGFFVNR